MTSRRHATRRPRAQHRRRPLWVAVLAGGTGAGGPPVGRRPMPPIPPATRASRPNGPTGCAPTTTGWWPGASRSSTSRPPRRPQDAAPRPQPGARDGRRRASNNDGPRSGDGRRPTAAHHDRSAGGAPGTTTAALPAPGAGPSGGPSGAAGRGAMAGHRADRSMASPPCTSWDVEPPGRAHGRFVGNDLLHHLHEVSNLGVVALRQVLGRANPPGIASGENNRLCVLPRSLLSRGP